MKLQMSANQSVWSAIAGIVTGVIAAVLTRLGNPIDGGISVSCFERDIAGALGLHQILHFSYLRPEIIGIVIGAFTVSVIKKNFKSVGGSSTALRFFISVIISFGVFVFIGCPMRLCLRIAGGDPTALTGLLGIIAGAWLGTLLLKKGFSLGRSYETKLTNALVLPVLAVVLLVLVVFKPWYLVMCKTGHALLVISLVAGIVVGVLAQRTKLCFISGFRNFFAIQDISLLIAFFSFIVAVGIANILLGQSHFGIRKVGSGDIFWNFTAMLLVGSGSTLLGGCPFRQLILSSQGNTDSAASVLGIMVGAAISYNFYIAYIAGSIDANGKIAVLAGIVLFIIIGFLNLRKK